MTNKIRVVFILFIFASLIFPFSSNAEDGLEGSIEVGGAIADLDSKSFKYGEYTGISDDGPYITGDADLSYNRNAFFFDFRAKDVGLENRSLYLEEGVYGKYKLYIGYDELTHLISNTSKTIFDGAGGTNLTLPSGFTKGLTTSAMSNLANSRHDIELETMRKTGTVGFGYSLGSNADFKILFKRENKEGTKSIGGTLGTSGGTTRSVVLPEPVDYITDELMASIAYNGGNAQMQFDYYLSKFDNESDSIFWESPFSGDIDTAATTVFPPTIARTSLPPDNQHQRFSLSGGINLPFATRVSAVAEYGIMEQDDTFLPYSNNPNSTITTPLPRGAADAEIDTAHLELNISSRPSSRLGLTAKYRYYETDNKTPRDLFLYVKNDSNGTNSAASQAVNSSSYALYNLPYDSTQNLLKLDASYYLFSGTTIKIGYDHDIIDRDYREIEETRENTYRTKLNSSLSLFASAGVNYSYAERRAKGNYEESIIYDAYHTQEYVAAEQAAGRAFDNNPFLRKYDIADRDRTKYGADVTLFIIPDATIGLYYSYMQNDYYGSILGLQKDENKNYTVDITYTPADFISTYTYYTREELKSKQAGREFTTKTPTGNYVDLNRNWWADHNEDVDTVGVGLNLGFMENKLTVGADYSYSESTGTVKLTAGSDPSVIGYSDMPDLKTKLQTVNTSAKYKLTKNTTVGVGYQYENYKSDDWATDNLDPASSTVANVITLSGSVPDYEAHQAMLTVAYNW